VTKFDIKYAITSAETCRHKASVSNTDYEDNAKPLTQKLVPGLPAMVAKHLKPKDQCSRQLADRCTDCMIRDFSGKGVSKHINIIISIHINIKHKDQLTKLHRLLVAIPLTRSSVKGLRLKRLYILRNAMERKIEEPTNRRRDSFELMPMLSVLEVCLVPGLGALTWHRRQKENAEGGSSVPGPMFVHTLVQPRQTGPQ